MSRNANIQTMPSATPELHFPSPYKRPSYRPVWAQTVRTADGAQLACFVYSQSPAPWSVQAAPETQSPQGVPILFLHGNGEEHGIFGPVIDAVVEAGMCAIALDSRAQGKSSRGKEALSYELLASDAWCVLDSLGVEQVHLVGFSDGGIEALLMASDQPSRIASLCAIGANLTPEGVKDDDWNLQEAIETLEAWAEEAWPQSVNSSLLLPNPQEAQAQAELLQLMLNHPHIAPQQLALISCPTTIMAGEFDVIREEETVAIARAIPGAELVIVPGAGHVLPKHEPAMVIGAVLATICKA